MIIFCYSSYMSLRYRPENYATITYRLNSDNGQISLSVTQEGFKDRKAYDHSAESWEGVLKGLKELLES